MQARNDPYRRFLESLRKVFGRRTKRPRRPTCPVARAEQLEERCLLALSPFDLGQLLAANGGDGSDGVVLQAAASADAVSNLGDISGDGIDDLAVTAPGSAVAGNPNGSGQTYVVLGTGTAFSAEFDLTTLNGTNGFILAGIDDSERLGEAVAAAGDVNNDGIRDILVGGPQADANAANSSGRTYVVFGRDVSVNPFPGVFQLTTLLTANGGDGSAGFAINGELADDLSGSSVAGAGDVTGDGIDDLIVGVASSDVAGNNSGSSYVVFGRNAAVAPFPAEVELSSLLAANGGDGSTGFAVHGAAAGDLSGISVSSAGDFNNDGIDDIVIGASMANSPGGFNESPGEAYVLFGRDIGVNPFAAENNLSDLFAANGGDGTQGFVMLGITGFFGGGDHLGRAVAPAGDLNNDGIDDIILGAPDANTAPPGSNGQKGEAYVIFGRSNVAGTLGAEFPLADLLPANGGDGSDGIVFPGVDFADRTGSMLALVGDVNNDTIEDILIGAPGGTPHGNRSGEAYLVFGSSNPFPAVFDVTVLDGTNGLVFHGFERLDDLTGVPISVFGVAEATAISGGGDINNDGIDDLIIGAPGRDETFVVFGGMLDGNGIAEQEPFSFDLSNLEAANGGDGSQGTVFNGFANIGDPGFSVSTAGDVNNDTIDDFLIGAPGQGSGGTVFVVFGTNTGFPAEVTLNTLNGSNGFTITGLRFVDGGGGTLGAAGDVNGDGIADIVIGAPRADADGAGVGGPFDDHGQTYVFFGRNTAFPETVTFESLLAANGGDGSLGFVINGIDADDRSGTSVSAGDMNNDGFADIIIGAPNAENVGGLSDAGESYLVFGRDASQNPFAAEFELSTLLPANGGDGSTGVILNGIGNGNMSGTSVHTAGDYNNDGFDDLIIGAPNVNSNRGEAYLVLGSSSFGAVVELSSLLAANGGDGSAGTVFQGFGTFFAGGDRAGRVVSSAGDVNNDGFDDLIIESPGANINGNNEAKGESYVIFGRSNLNTLGAEFPLDNLFPANGGDGSNGFVLQGVNFGDGTGNLGGSLDNTTHPAGDLNNDGFDDIISARQHATPHGNDSGQTYVVFGSGSPYPAVLDLRTLDGDNGLALNGISVGELSGSAAAGAGDVNNDGFDDLIIGAPSARPDTFAAGRAYLVAGRASFVPDQDSPQPVIDATQSSPTNADPINISVDFGEAVIGFVLGEVAVTNGVASNFDTTDEQTFTFDISPAADGEVTVNIPAGVARDAAGNNSEAATELSIASDRTPPTPLITATQSSPTNADPINISVDFGEPVSGFVLGEVAVTNGVASDFDTTDEQTFTFDISPAADGEVTVNIPAGVARDAAGNNSEAATELSIASDRTPPMPLITATQSSPTNADPINISVDFGEPVSGFVLGEVAVTNGVASNFDTTDEQTFTFDISSAADGAVMVNIAANVAQDAAGNNNQAATEFSIINDQTPPTVAFSRTAASPTDDDMLTFRATFSEDVNGVTAADFTLATTGSVTANAAVTVGDAGDADDSTYTVTVDTVAGGGTLGLDIAAGHDIMDNASNTLDATPTLDEFYTIDNTPSDEIGVRLGGGFFLDTNGNGTWDGVAGGDDRVNFGRRSDKPIIGDWNGDGIDDVGVRRKRQFFLDANGSGRWDGVAGGDARFSFGRASDDPVVGDWDGDGVDEVGIHRGRQFFLDTNGNGRWDGVAGGDDRVTFGRRSDDPISGDWDGDGVDQIGVHRRKIFFLDANADGKWNGVGGGDVRNTFGRRSDDPIIGDWDGDGVDQIGVHRGKRFYLDANGDGTWNGVAGGDVVRTFGGARNKPLIGNWAEELPLLAAGGPLEVSAASENLSQEALSPIVDYAVAAWQEFGLERSAVRRLDAVQVQIADLPGARLGQLVGNTLTVDINAAGYGWFVDAIPKNASEFAALTSGLRPTNSIDLLTVIMHELGHAAGLEDHYGTGGADDLMYGWLTPGERRTAIARSLSDEVFAGFGS